MEKVKFGLRNKKIVVLPSSGATVEMYEDLTVGEMRDIFQKYPMAQNTSSLDAQEANIEMLLKMIISWNFVDENGDDLSVSKELLNQLTLQDLTSLSQIVEEKFKKK